MTIYSSPKFLSCITQGTDWRDTSKNILEQIEKVRTKENKFNIGFLYVSDYLASDMNSILGLFKSVLNIENWVGTVGLGVCGCGENYIDVPAISVMIGHVDEKDFCIFPLQDPDNDKEQDSLEGSLSVEQNLEQNLKSWLSENDPLLVVTHGNPLSEKEPMHNLNQLQNVIEGFIVGGLSSSRHNHAQFANECIQSDLSGIAFSSTLRVATTLSQGCMPIGDTHEITRGSDHFIGELDNKKALDVFEDNIKNMAYKKIEKNPDEIVLEKDPITGEEIIPEEFQHLMEGEVHVGFPISQSDQQDYLVRNIIGVDPDSGTLSVSQPISKGENIVFVHRNKDTMQKDLTEKLIALRERVQKEQGHFDVKGALYISCVARGLDEDKDDENSEMKLIQKIIGDIPLTGFYAGGEILNARIYGYTGILTLFL